MVQSPFIYDVDLNGLNSLFFFIFLYLRKRTVRNNDLLQHYHRRQ